MRRLSPSLRGKILLIATAVILCAIGAVVATSAYMSANQYAAALQSRSLAIGKGLTIQLERLLHLGIELNDIRGFEEQCRQVVESYSGIDLAMVVRPDGQVLFHSDQASLPTGPAPEPLRGQLFETIVSSEDGEASRHHAVVPAFDLEGNHVASVVVGFPAALVSSGLSRLVTSNLAVGALVLILGLLVLYLTLARYVMRPLRSLIGTVTTLRRAPLILGGRTSITSNDELGQLSRAFNGLMDELQNTTVSKAELEQALEQLQDVSAALFIQKEKVEVTLSSIGDAVIGVDADTCIEYLNPAAEALTGWDLDQVRGQRIQQILRFADAFSGEPLSDPFEPAFLNGEATANEVDAALHHREGRTVDVDYIAAPMHTPTGELSGGVLTLRDVSRERAMAKRLLWEASHDPLTGLVNRREFNARVEASLESARTRQEHHVVCFMDLDSFKVLNDTAGHAAGDEFLKALAGDLLGRIDPHDTFARLGGDEFALLLERCSMDQAERVAAAVLSAVEEFRFSFQSRTYSVGVSIGLASVAPDSTCADILSMADTACYWAKEQGRNRISIYRNDDQHMTQRRRESSWVTRISAALAEDRFVLYHQSYLPLNAGASERDHLEVLLRMIDEEGHIVSPASFIPAAERYNLMPSIDRWVISHVFAGYAQLLAERGGRPLTCAINLSGTSLNAPGLLEFIAAQAQSHAIPPKAICLEITETAAINNLQLAVEFVKACKAFGILFALDDFGTGTSSFGYLKKLPVDYLKIDGGFVQNMEHDDIDRAMTQTIHRIGQIMGIRTVAEYAENDAIIAQLRAIGVTYAQGYGVSLPKPLFAMADS